MMENDGRRSAGATILYGLIAFGGTLTLLDNLGLYDVTDVVDVDENHSEATNVRPQHKQNRQYGCCNVYDYLGCFRWRGGPRWTVRPTLVDSTIEPTNETQSVYVDVTGIDDMNGSGPVSVDVSITGLNASDDTLNGTTVDSQTLSVTQGNVSTYDYTLNQSDIDDYDELQIDSSVVTDGDESLIDSVDWGGSLVENAGGAGGGLGGVGSIAGIPILDLWR